MNHMEHRTEDEKYEMGYAGFGVIRLEGLGLMVWGPWFRVHGVARDSSGRRI